METTRIEVVADSPVISEGTRQNIIHEIPLDSYTTPDGHIITGDNMVERWVEETCLISVQKEVDDLTTQISYLQEKLDKINGKKDQMNTAISAKQAEALNK